MTDAIIVHPLVQYTSVNKAKDALLDAYFGDGCFERDLSANLAGISSEDASNWFMEPLFYKKIEKRLQAGTKRRSSMQETLLDEVQNIMSGNIADVFEQTAEGNLIIKNIKTLPRYVTAAIKQMDVIRTSVPGRPAEFTECLRIVMHDKTKVMNIAGDFTDVKNKALKNVDSGAPKMVGMHLSLAGEKKEVEDGSEISGGGEVCYDGSTEGDSA